MKNWCKKSSETTDTSFMHKGDDDAKRHAHAPPTSSATVAHYPLLPHLQFEHLAPRQLGPPAPGSALGLAGAPRRLRLRVRARLRVEHRLPGLPLCVRLRRLLLILARLLLLLLPLLLLQLFLSPLLGA